MTSEEKILMASDDPDKRIEIIFHILSNILGPDHLVLKARKMSVLKLINSSHIGDRLLALQRLVFDDLGFNSRPSKEQYDLILKQIEDEIANKIAQRTVEMDLDRLVKIKMNQHQHEYVNELRREILNETKGRETSSTLNKLKELQQKDSTFLEKSALSVIRPTSLSEIVGQDKAIASLKAKLGTMYPQHVILYGPPGVGKTTAARLVLEYVKTLENNSFSDNAPFVEVDATTIRWDSREISNPLLGSVHDPIYQGSKKNLSDDGIPEPKTGLVTKAHGGVLFLDEIGELDPILLNKLLKVLEDKRVFFESSYYDEDDPRVPAYIKRLFSFGAPADFILVGATTRQPEDIPLALRSRCSEVYFEPLSVSHINEIVNKAAERIDAHLAQGVAEEISRYTLEGRKAVQIVVDVLGMVSGKGTNTITLEDVHECVRINRLTSAISVKAGDSPEIGRVFGIGVSGFLGSCLEIEASAFKALAPGKGTMRFNEAAGQMAKDSVFNAGSVLRFLFNKDIADYDLHVNVLGGGKVDGPSAGLAVTLALHSALNDLPIRPDLAVTGEVSIRGKVKAVGGISEKIHGAVQAGMKIVLVPWDNQNDVPSDVPEDVKIVPIKTVKEAIEYLA